MKFARCVEWLPKGDLLACGDSYAKVSVHSKNGTKIAAFAFEETRPRVTGLGVLNETSFIAVGAGENLKTYQLCILQLDGNTLTCTWSQASEGYWTRLSPVLKNHVLVASNGNEWVEMWDMEAKRITKSFKRDIGEWCRCAFVGDYIVGGDERDMVVWDRNTGKELSKANAHELKINGVCVKPNANEWVTYSVDGEFVVWKDSSVVDKPAISAEDLKAMADMKRELEGLHRLVETNSTAHASRLTTLNKQTQDKLTTLYQDQQTLENKFDTAAGDIATRLNALKTTNSELRSTLDTLTKRLAAAQEKMTTLTVKPKTPTLEPALNETVQQLQAMMADMLTVAKAPPPAVLPFPTSKDLVLISVRDSHCLAHRQEWVKDTFVTYYEFLSVASLQDAASNPAFLFLLEHDGPDAFHLVSAVFGHFVVLALQPTLYIGGYLATSTETRGIETRLTMVNEGDVVRFRGKGGVYFAAIETTNRLVLGTRSILADPNGEFKLHAVR